MQTVQDHIHGPVTVHTLWMESKGNEVYACGLEHALVADITRILPARPDICAAELATLGVKYMYICMWTWSMIRVLVTIQYMNI